jgi:hypothetical protein
MNEPAFDAALDTALTKKDFGSVRGILRTKGYALPEDESDPDLVKALCMDQSDEGGAEEDTYLLIIEKELRSRQAQTLRNILFMTGHKIARPDTNLLVAEEQERRRAGFPIYVQHNTLEL